MEVNSVFFSVARIMQTPVLWVPYLTCLPLATGDGVYS